MLSLSAQPLQAMACFEILMLFRMLSVILVVMIVLALLGGSMFCHASEYLPGQYAICDWLSQCRLCKESSEANSQNTVQGSRFKQDISVVVTTKS